MSPSTAAERMVALGMATMPAAAGTAPRRGRKNVLGFPPGLRKSDPAAYAKLWRRKRGKVKAASQPEII